MPVRRVAMKGSTKPHDIPIPTGCPVVDILEPLIKVLAKNAIIFKYNCVFVAG
jgi:hypothetical protein